MNDIWGVYHIQGTQNVINYRDNMILIKINLFRIMKQFGEVSLKVFHHDENIGVVGIPNTTYNIKHLDGWYVVFDAWELSLNCDFCQ